MKRLLYITLLLVSFSANAQYRLLTNGKDSVYIAGRIDSLKANKQPLENQRLSTTNLPQFTGVNVLPQSNLSTPSAGFNITDSTGAGATFIFPSGIRKSLNWSNVTGNSIWKFQNKSYTVADSADVAGKQATLVSGTNIKTIGGNSLLGSGDIAISGGGASTATLKSVTQNGYVTPLYTKFGDTSLSKAVQTMVGFGDSYMRGSGAFPASLSFFNLMALYNNAIPDMRGLTGTTMQHFTTNDSCMFDRIYLIPQYNGTQRLLIFEYGTNDISQSTGDTATFRTTYLRVIDTALARGWTTGKMLLITPGYFSTDQVKRVNYITCVKNIGAARGIPVADVWAMDQAEGYSNILAPDSLHPNNRGHRLIVRAALNAEQVAHGTELVLHGKLYTNYITATANPNEVNPSVLDFRDSSQTNFAEVRGSSHFNSFGIGVGSLMANTSGNANTAYGDSTLPYSTGGASNSAFGYKALLSNTNGTANTAVGTSAMAKDTASNNTAVGASALGSNVGGGNNTAVGSAALTNNTASSNTAVGANALTFNTIASNVTAVGNSALTKNTTGSQNTATGSLALQSNTTGGQNIAVGYNALGSNVTNNSSTAIGHLSLAASTADFNTGIGSTALTVNTTGTQNTSVGSRSLEKNTTGSQNVALGYFAGFQTTTGAGNIYIGKDAGNNVTYATLSNKLVIGNNTTLPLLDGTMATTVAAQSLTLNGKLLFPATITTTGTTGAQTINNPSGTVNIAAAGTSVTVTNSLVTTSSIVYCVIRTNDANNISIKSVVPAAGSFTINLTEAVASEISIGFIVYN